MSGIRRRPLGLQRVHKEFAERHAATPSHRTTRRATPSAPPRGAWSAIKRAGRWLLGRKKTPMSRAPIAATVRPPTWWNSLTKTLKNTGAWISTGAKKAKNRLANWVEPKYAYIRAQRRHFDGETISARKHRLERGQRLTRNYYAKKGKDQPKYLSGSAKSQLVGNVKYNKTVKRFTEESMLSRKFNSIHKRIQKRINSMLRTISGAIGRLNPMVIIRWAGSRAAAFFTHVFNRFLQIEREYILKPTRLWNIGGSVLAALTTLGKRLFGVKQTDKNINAANSTLMRVAIGYIIFQMLPLPMQLSIIAGYGIIRLRNSRLQVADAAEAARAAAAAAAAEAEAARAAQYARDAAAFALHNTSAGRAARQISEAQQRANAEAHAEELAKAYHAAAAERYRERLHTPRQRSRTPTPQPGFLEQILNPLGSPQRTPQSPAGAAAARLSAAGNNIEAGISPAVSPERAGSPAAQGAVALNEMLNEPENRGVLGWLVGLFGEIEFEEGGI